MVAAGTSLLDAGFLDVTGGLTNNGTIDAEGAFTVGQDIAGNGTLDVGAAALLTLQAGTGLGQTIKYLGETGVFELNNPLAFLGTIVDFGAHDVIDLEFTGEPAGTGYNFAAGTLTIVEGGTTIAKLQFDGQYEAGSFALSIDGHGGILLTYV